MAFKKENSKFDRRSTKTKSILFDNDNNLLLSKYFDVDAIHEEDDDKTISDINE